MITPRCVGNLHYAYTHAAGCRCGALVFPLAADPVPAPAEPGETPKTPHWSETVSAVAAEGDARCDALRADLARLQAERESWKLLAHLLAGKWRRSAAKRERLENVMQLIDCADELLALLGEEPPA